MDDKPSGPIETDSCQQPFVQLVPEVTSVGLSEEPVLRDLDFFLGEHN